MTETSTQRLDSPKPSPSVVWWVLGIATTLFVSLAFVFRPSDFNVAGALLVGVGGILAMISKHADVKNPATSDRWSAVCIAIGGIALLIGAVTGYEA